MIKAIFYARFHHERGNIIAHQVPPGSIAAPAAASWSEKLPAHASSDEYPLFDFSAVDKFLIPRQEFCDRLVTICTNHYRIIGHPVCIQSPKYYRNEFIFNLAIVLDEDAEFSAYTSIVRKLARILRQLEEQSQFLSKEEEDAIVDMGGSIGSLGKASAIGTMEESGELEKLPLLDELSAGEQEMTGSGLSEAYEKEQEKKVYALCEMIMEDLNNYCECMIPIDSSNTINLKLFPTRPTPAPVYAWHVPLSTVELSTIAQSSDLTLTRIIPYIDGVASVSQISQLADTDLGLTRKAIQHLLYYGCVLLLDIFQFGAVYAPTPEMSAFIEDDEAQEEAVRYVCMGTYRKLKENEMTGSGGKEEWGWRSQEIGVDKAKLVHLYTTLKQGQTLKHWCLENAVLISGIDVRRFITFGIIKGFLYRVHKYVIAPSVVGGSLTSLSQHTNKRVDFANHNGHLHDVENEVVDRRYSVGMHREPDVRHSVGGFYSRRPSIDGEMGDVSQQKEDRLPLARYLDGLHCLDEVCTELGMSEKRVLEKMKAAFGEVYVVHR
ncbi:uncharacterized protein PV09_00637 [Verruconis gallopava]|uniref:Nitrogen permease regulator 2 n=1 Tax=Verruconis gallopava TaxID=253628 RepID=A0A0D2APR6_9PEZI|nr:uncharacterized protein PV09_00637 [Verruconis gallopava]KIW08688.1 hypothetical protein PV09_00637 [Verruconis gallopava]